MAQETAGDALVLADADGNYYVLPRELIELSKVRDETKDQVEEQAGADTSGYSALGGGFSFVGVLNLSPSSKWSHFTPNVGWPYYLPQNKPGETQIDPSA